jgi:hypothetical protein
MDDNLHCFANIPEFRHNLVAERYFMIMDFGYCLERHLDIIYEGKYALKQPSIASFVRGTDCNGRIHFLI